MARRMVGWTCTWSASKTRTVLAGNLRFKTFCSSALPRRPRKKNEKSRYRPTAVDLIVSTGAGPVERCCCICGKAQKNTCTWTGDIRTGTGGRVRVVMTQRRRPNGGTTFVWFR